MPLVPAALHRAWMDGTPDRFAYRCLPLNLANQHGWFVLNRRAFRALWTGGTEIGAVIVECVGAGAPTAAALSHFGSGILTFHIPYVFRTPPGFNLLVRGPANLPKDGIGALEGIVETDWAVATSTMNWQFTRRDIWVHFEQNEPICMLVPMRRGMLESLQPEIHRLEEDPMLKEQHESWSLSRRLFLAEGRLGLLKTTHEWEKHYLHGTYPAGPKVAAPDHRLVVKEFQWMNREK